MQPDGKLEARLGRYAGVREPAAGIERVVCENGRLKPGESRYTSARKISRNHVFKWNVAATGYRVLG